MLLKHQNYQNDSKYKHQEDRASDVSRSREMQVNPLNPAKFGGNLIRYMSVLILKLVSATGVTCRKLANSCQNFVTETCKQRSETTRRRLCCEKLGTSHDVKGFAIGSFL